MTTNTSPPTGKPLHHLFTSIPQRYDLINSIITWGLDRKWRDKAASECLKSQPTRFLDLCCGTGDLAIRVAQLAPHSREMDITGVDYSQPMLDIAAEKARAATGRKITFASGNAAELPFADSHFDCVGISFAFRNLTYKNPLIEQHLNEAFRVLKPDGRFVIVETSQPKSKLIRILFHLYLRWFVFHVGRLLSGNRQAYHYLKESAARFYTSEEVADMLIKTGFRQVTFRPLFLGATGIHVAVK